MKTTHSIGYRPDIDGLRALAVLPVIFFHAKLGCPGGYVGVDVFFVISGFLITSMILRDLKSGRFSLADFWERRIRRIFPALLGMVLVSLLAGGLLLLPHDYERLGKSAIAQAMLAANVFFWRDDKINGGYFGPTSEERPLLHTWSLSVEEQFYVIFPLVLMGLFRFERFRQPGTLSRILLTGVLMGLAVAAYGVRTSPGATFYLLPSRAWELLCGAWIASLPDSGGTQRRWVREGASWAGLTGILIPCWLYTGATPFPGLAALPPCLGTALLIWSNSGKAEVPIGLTFVGRLLARRPFVFTGLISYSLYLWHWPVLVFGQYWWLPVFKPWTLRAGLLLAAALLASLSWRFVETPFRQKKVMPTRRAAFRFAAAGSAATLLYGALLTRFHGFPERFPEKSRQNIAAISDRADSWDMEIEGVMKGRLIPFGWGGNEARVLLWGDSHAKHALPAMDALCRETGVQGAAAVRSSMPPLLGHALQAPGLDIYDKTHEFSLAVLEYVKRRGITHAVLAAFWSRYRYRDALLFENALRTTIETLHSMGCKVWVLQDVPSVDADAPRAVAASSIFGDDPSWRRLVSDHRRRNAAIYNLVTQGLPAVFIDPAPLLLEPGSDRYRAEIGGVSIYHDNNHLTKTASKALLLPILREAMAPDLLKLKGR